MIITPGCLVFDIGANVGTVSEEFLVSGAGRVIAVEPCLENYRAVVNRSRADDRIVPIHAACWFEPGIIGVNYATNQSGLSSCQPDKWSKVYPDAQWAKTEYVPAITIAQLIKEFGIPQLIKIDVEGSELQVLQGLYLRSQYLMFEFHHKFQNDAVKCLRFCQRLGYTRAHYVRDNLDLNTIPTTPIDEFIPRWTIDGPEWGNITVS